MAHPNTENKPDEGSGDAFARLQQRIASAVRIARADLQLSKESVAQRAGVSPSRMTEIEKGNANPRLATLVRVATALGLEVKIETAA